MLWIGLFLTSLNDYYVAAISGSPLPVLGLLLLAFHCGRFNQLRWLEKAYLLVITLSFIVGFYRLSTDLAVEVKFTNGIGWLAGFGALLIDLQTRKDELEKALRIFLIIHVGFFFLQGVVYVSSGFYIDPLVYVTGEPQRYLAETHTLRISVFSIRPTGFFLEPSNYAVHILPIAFLYYSHTKRMTPVIGMAIASVALTFSSWAFIAVAVSVLMFARGLRSQMWFALATWLFVYAFADWFMARTFDVQYTSGSYWTRQEFAGLVLWRVLELSPGLGIGVYRPWDVNVPWDANTINDSGVLIYLLYVFGINALLLLVPLFACITGWRNKFFLVITLTSKLSPTYPFFWILINLLSRQANEREHPGADPEPAGLGVSPASPENWPKRACGYRPRASPVRPPAGSG